MNVTTTLRYARSAHVEYFASFAIAASFLFRYFFSPRYAMLALMFTLLH